MLPHAAADWIIKRLGNHAAKDVKVCFKKDATNARLRIVIDIGSNSVKLVAYDCTTTPPAILDEHSLKCGLGADMKPHDKHARLNPAAMRKINREALPAWRSIIAKHKPGTMIVVCTEAVRAAHANRDERKNVEAFLGNVAKNLGLPAKGIDIVSKKLEARLGVEAALCGDIDNCDAIMGGGNSFEFFQIRGKHMVPGRHTTRRFGTGSLKNAKNYVGIIEEELAKVSWFPDRRYEPDTAARTAHLCLLGGAFRFVGRLLAERINRLNPIDAKTEFGGHTFAWDSAGVLKGHLLALQNSTKNELFRASFGASAAEILKKCRTLKDKNGGKVSYVPIRWEGRDILVKESDFEKMRAKWENKIGSRADTLRVVVQAILEAEARVRPRTINFSRQTLRDGVLRYTRLGYI
jgi:exopolyphosphatase/pppGpp-phosphohydrolase